MDRMRERVKLMRGANAIGAVIGLLILFLAGIPLMVTVFS